MQAAFKAIEFMHSGTAAGADKPSYSVHPRGIGADWLRAGDSHDGPGHALAHQPANRTNTRLQPSSVVTGYDRTESLLEELQQHRQW